MSAPADPLDRLIALANRQPDRPAVVEGASPISYGEFAGRVAELAGHIVEIGCEHPKVALDLDQGTDAYIAMFATLMAGGYYCPLNTRHPLARRNKVLELFEPDVVITTPQRRTGELVCSGARVIGLDQQSSVGRLRAPRPPHALSYVMFTSGSTGEPKGVMIPRAGLSHYVRWAGEAMAISPEDRWSQHPNIAFDLSVLDIYGALCFGACLFPLTQTRYRLAPALAIRDHQLTIWNSVPSVIDLIASARHLTPDTLRSLRLMTFCGEPLLREHLDLIFSARPDMMVHNTYGPTEATVSCTLLRLTADNYLDKCGRSAALGTAIAGMAVELSGAGNGEGEVIISGPQVALGYWRRPDLSQAAFFVDPNDASRRGYRTGDWAERRGDDIYFVARTDRQVKKSGYRIELADIDAAVRSLTGSLAFTVFVDGRLHSFIETTTTTPANELIAKLRAMLPDYMIPDTARAIGALPRNANDKIDANALEALARGSTP